MGYRRAKIDLPNHKKPAPSGWIIVLEGIDGSGKSTLTRAMENHFSGREKSTVVITSACLADAAQNLQTILASQNLEPRFDGESAPAANDDTHPICSALLRSAQLAQQWYSIAANALQGGRIVIFDRYVYSALVRERLRGVPMRFIRNIYAYLHEPDVVIYLDASPEVALRRKQEAGLELGVFESGVDLQPGASREDSFVTYQARCKKEYDKVLPQDVRRLDADHPASDVWRQTHDILERTFGSRRR